MRAQVVHAGAAHEHRNAEHSEVDLGWHHSIIMLAVDFDVWDADDIRAVSVVEVVRSTCEDQGLPAAGGPADERFGTVGSGPCKTCGMNRHKCHGHWGYYT